MSFLSRAQNFIYMTALHCPTSVPVVTQEVICFYFLHMIICMRGKCLKIPKIQNLPRDKNKQTNKSRAHQGKKLQVGRDAMPNHSPVSLSIFTTTIPSLNQCFAVFGQPQIVTRVFLFSLVLWRQTSSSQK